MAKQLFELQEVDLDIEGKKESVEQIESKLGESQTLAEMRASLAQQEERLAQASGEQRTLEWQLDDLSVKISREEDKLYGGSVRNPKELADLQREVEHLKGRRRQLEDRVIDIMSEVELTEVNVRNQSAQVGDLEQIWRREQERLEAERIKLLSEIVDLEERRRGLAAQIDADSLDLYQRLRETRQGKAVVRVEQGMCQGCRITLPMTELQQARAGQRLVQCGSCGRILYVS